VERQRERRLHAAERQALEDARIADRREHEILVADAAGRAEQVDRVEHVVEVVRGLAHAHEHDLLHGAPRPRERHLRDDLGAADVALQALPTGHAEHAADGATDLRRHAQPAARQQHALDGLTVREIDEEPHRAVLAGMLGPHARERREFVRDVGSAARSCAGRKLSGRRRPLSSGSAFTHARSTRSSWTGFAPRARSSALMSSIRMGADGASRPRRMRGPRRHFLRAMEGFRRISVTAESSDGRADRRTDRRLSSLIRPARIFDTRHCSSRHSSERWNPVSGRRDSRPFR
jgi:hypothetical protein